MTAIVDTSVVVGAEAGRVHQSDLPEQAFVSAITIGELHLGVLTSPTMEKLLAGVVAEHRVWSTTPWRRRGWTT